MISWDKMPLSIKSLPRKSNTKDGSRGKVNILAKAKAEEQAKLAKAEKLKLAKAEKLKDAKPKRSTISPEFRQAIWNKTNKEENIGKCYCCLKRIFRSNFDCGHNIALIKGGPTDLNNMFAICESCNSRMSDNYSIDEWKIKIGVRKYLLILK